jgi:hypothetical protein
MKTLKSQLLKGSIRILSLLILVSAFACEGPRGPSGSDGFDGIDGEINAYSAMYEVSPSSWEGDYSGLFATLPMAEITGDIYENGAVLVYWMNDAAQNFSLLPYWYMNSEGLTINVACDIYIGSVDIFYQEIFDGLPDTFVPEETYYFKVVVIDAIPLATVKSMVDINDFNAVTKTFNVVEKEFNGLNMQ